MSDRFILLFLLNIVIATKVTVYNSKQRLDTQGNIVNAHDGCLVQFNSTYYIYGTVYENCHQKNPTCDGICGYINNTFALYKSNDLVSWQLISKNILPEISKDCDKINYWSPNVAYNPITKTYFMTFWSGHFGFKNSQVAVATSKSPTEPFTLQMPITMRGAKVISSTIGLFVASNGKAYVRYNTRDAPLRHVLEELTPDWMNTTGRFSTIYTKNEYPWYEGGGMFEYNGKYFTMLGTDCCFCQWGADAKIFSAIDPIGTWTEENEVNFCANGKMPPSKVASQEMNPCSLSDVQGTNFTIPAQQFNVATLKGRTGPLFLYYGERFRSSPDGIKAHDYQAWIPLSFNSQGNVLPMKWLDSFDLDLL